MKKLRTAFVACSVTMAATLCPIAFAQDVKKPNIVLINMDNFGWGEPGFNGGGIIRGTATPNMDQLAAEGLRLTNFNVEAQCTPSRAALMSGRYGVRSGNHTIPLGGGVYGLTQWEVTIAEMLEEVGYYSAAYGKWHLGWSEGRYPTNQGFDEFYGIESVEQSIWPSQPESASSGFEPPVVMQGIKGEPASVVREWNLEYRARIDGDLTEKANDFIRRRAETGEPFFLYLPYTATHFPTLVVFSLSALYRDPLSDIGTPGVRGGHGQWRLGGSALSDRHLCWPHNGHDRRAGHRRQHDRDLHCG
jgi:arylsulfatase